MNNIPSLPLRMTAAVGSVLALLCMPARADSETEAALARRLDQLAAELAAVKSQLAAMRESAARAPAAGEPQPAAAGAYASSDHAGTQAATVLSGYGEINYNRPTHAGEDTQADLRRFVIGVEHRVDERTKIVSELEIEHAVSSADDPGEVEVEQAYVEHEWRAGWAARAGLFLMPVGLLNESHEPTAYYGVERNFVETSIIPTTWREGGLQIIGQLDNGLTLQGGLSTGFDLGKWDAASAEGASSPLGSIHQELALASSRDLSLFGAANWRGMPGLLLGGSIFTGGATQGRMSTGSRVTLWDLHARWTPGRWDLSTLYSQGTISNTAALNMPLVGNPTLIPARFDGAYLQAAYRLWSSENRTLSPFARIERFNTARRFADLGPGITPSAARTEQVLTLGANLAIAQGVVVKADVQRFRESPQANRVDLGLGWSF